MGEIVRGTDNEVVEGETGIEHWRGLGALAAWRRTGLASVSGSFSAPVRVWR